MSDLFVYVDESVRSGRYLLGAVLVEPAAAGQLRRTVRKLLLPGQRRLHFNNEGRRRRRELLGAIGRLDVEALVYSSRHSAEVTAEAARARCLAAIVDEVQHRHRRCELLIESRDHMDTEDGITIRRARRPEPLLSFQHLRPDHDPLLWLPDGIAWAVGAGGDWRRRAGSFVTIVEVG